MKIGEEQRHQFNEDGYFVLERAVPEGWVQILREECSYFIGCKDQELEQKGDST